MNPALIPWTPADEAVVREGYGRVPTAELAARLGRTYTAIQKRAVAIDAHQKPRWSAHDDELLRHRWGEMSVQKIAKATGRTCEAIYRRAGRLGLKAGCPDGYEYLWHAARRAGYAIQTLRMILRWAGVEIRRSMSRRMPGVVRKRPSHIVDPFDVDTAVEAWVRTETVAGAAKRRGIGIHFLRGALLRFGKNLPPNPAGKAHWRVETETIDVALEAARAHETLSAAARRLGIHSITLRKRLLEARVPRTPGKSWMLLAATFDEVARRAA